MFNRGWVWRVSHPGPSDRTSRAFVFFLSCVRSLDSHVHRLTSFGYNFSTFIFHVIRIITGWVGEWGRLIVSASWVRVSNVCANVCPLLLHYPIWIKYWIANIFITASTNHVPLAWSSYFWTDVSLFYSTAVFAGVHFLWTTGSNVSDDTRAEYSFIQVMQESCWFCTDEHDSSSVY